MRKNMSEENEEIKRWVFECYEKHGCAYGNDYVIWRGAERQRGIRPRLCRSKHIKNTHPAIWGIACVAVAILLIMLFKKNPVVEPPQKRSSEIKIMVLVLDLKEGEKVFVFGDMHFNFAHSAPRREAKAGMPVPI